MNRIPNLIPDAWRNVRTAGMSFWAAHWNEARQVRASLAFATILTFGDQVSDILIWVWLVMGPNPGLQDYIVGMFILLSNVASAIFFNSRVLETAI